MIKVGNGGNTANEPAYKNLQVIGKDKPLQAETQSVSKGFWFLSRNLNPEYESGLVPVPLRTCLLHHNAAAKSGGNCWIIKTRPKWFTNLLQTDFDRNTGEILGQSVYQTDCLTAGNNRKIKAVNRFCEHFEPMYYRREVSLFFYTYTVANQAKLTIRDCMEAFKKRLKRRGINLQGYVWILEISDNLHVHYHAIIATDRIDYRGKFPDFLQLSELWGARVRGYGIKKSVRYYLAMYFTKNKNRIVGKRQYGLKMPKKK